MRIKRVLIYEGPEEWIRTCLLGHGTYVRGTRLLGSVGDPKTITEQFDRSDAVTAREAKLIDEVEAERRGKS